MRTMSDHEIRRAVLEELQTDPRVDELLLGVEVAGGSVTLTGLVRSEEKRLAAIEAARRVFGVRAVRDEVQVSLSGD